MMRQSLTRWEKIGIGLLAFALVAQGLNVTNRSNFLERRYTDLGVYLRAAWAARTGHDLYSIQDTNGFHYIYPPVFAILMTPLAEPPLDGLEAPQVPFLVSVILWYVFSVACVLLAVHVLASALEHDRRKESARRWWALRLLPLAVCLPPILGTLVHGQVNLLLLLLVAGFAAASLRGKSLTAGIFLAAAACLKIFPAFLIIEPLCRRDWRCLAGCMLGAGLFLVAIPVAYWGPERAWELHRRFAEVVLLPGAGIKDDASHLAGELKGGVAADSQSLQAVLHKCIYLDPSNRPAAVSGTLKLLGTLLGGLMTVVTLLAGRRRAPSARRRLLLIGALSVVMLALCPVTHLPYFVLLIPLVMALADHYWPEESQLPVGRLLTRGFTGWNVLMAAFGINMLARTLPHVPGLAITRDLGISLHAGLLLWLMGILVLFGASRRSTLANSAPAQRRIAA